MKDFQTDSEKLDLNIKYSATGTFYGAWLDYVEVTYSRKLKLRDGELFFRIQATLPTNIKVSGCSGSTRIWDVTDPMNPKEVKYTLTGSDAVFSCEGKLLEFIAFEPEKIKRQTINSIPIDNQDIHGMEVPDYLIITPPEYLAAANKIADLRRETDGMTVHVLTPDKLYNEFSSGMQDPTAFRKAMKMWHDRGARAGGKKLKYCLLLSRPTYDSKAVTPSVKNNPYPRLPQWQSTGIYIDDTAYGTDDYIGMMTDTSPFRMSRSKVDIAVGRFAVTSEQEANIMADKLVKYVKDPELGSWRNNVLMIADDGDSQTHMAQSDTALENMRNNGNGNNFVYERLYTDAYERKATGSGLAFPGAKERFINRLNEGVSFVNYVGHANPRGWTHENLFIWNDIIGMTNKRLPFLAAYCCEFLRWDADDVSGGEKMWLHPTSGVIGMLCASRSVFMGPNGRLNAAFGKNLFKRDATTGESLRIGDVMVAAKNEADTYDDNKFRFALLGDPAMKVPNPTYQTTIESIGDTPVVTTPSDYPQLGAGSKSLIKGSILRKDGTIADDFNGIVEVTLYDAEIPVTTNGYECNEYSYNERTTRLNSLRVKAVEGKWQTTLTVPMEINNNYSPARIVAYAYSDDGREANGSCENLYVYGYDPSDNADDAGPEIKRFVLNNDNFADGGAVSTSPVVLATVADPSGINVSDAGIGHKLSLILDGKTHYEDVNQYYMADHENEGQGMITYPLSDLEAGHHTLELCVWDNANNSSRATINFQVAVGVAPTIYDVCTDCNPARTSVVFTVSTDRAMSRLGCTLDVFDLNGAKVWTSTSDGATDNESNISFGWDLKDKSGRRVPRGIYLYRATVESPDGMTQTKTKKLAVTAE